MRNVRYGARVERETGAAVQAAALALGVTLSMAAHGGVIPLPAEIVPGPGYFSVDANTRLRVAPGDRDADNAARYLVSSMDPHQRSHRAGHHRTARRRRQRRDRRLPSGIRTVSRLKATGSMSRRSGSRCPQARRPECSTAPSPCGNSCRREPPRAGFRCRRSAMRRIYRWRGLMLDSARHFQSPAFIRSMIDWMAWHKLNVLHWHLTDDQGWRLEIRKYPRLTAVGAWRIEPDGTRYGGFYTQDEVRGIVRFAAAHHVQIVPEIDIPGHATAAIAAYPTLGAAIPKPARRRPYRRAGARIRTSSTSTPRHFASSRTSSPKSSRFSPVPRFTSAAMKWSRTNGPPRRRCRRGPDSWDSTTPARCRHTSRKGSAATSPHTRGGSSAGTRSCGPDCGRMPSSCLGTAWPGRTARQPPATTPSWHPIRRSTSTTGKARCRPNRPGA